MGTWNWNCTCVAIASLVGAVRVWAAGATSRPCILIAEAVEEDGGRGKDAGSMRHVAEAGEAMRSYEATRASQIL